MSTLPPFQEVMNVRKNNALGIRLTCFMVKKGGQRAPISPDRKIREPGGADDRKRKKHCRKDPNRQERASAESSISI